MSALAVVAGYEDREVADLDLVAGVRAGDDRAFERLFLRYQPRIAAYVGGMVHDHARAEDITQEVFLSALRRMRDGTDREIQFRPWIYEIAKNKCIDAYRRGRHTVEVSFDAHEALGADEQVRLAGPRPTPDAAVDDKLALDNLCGAFGGLSSVHHDILVMREFEGLSYREIGDRLGLSRPAVESTLFRARKRLSEEYEQLVSGERCRLVQRTVDASSGVGGAGLREQRRIARHLAHCQPCRRYARLAGADLGELAKVGRAHSAAARIAALLPLPAIFRRRWADGATASHPLGTQGARPATQSWAHVAGTLDPGMVTGWAKAVATAATVAVAGVGAGSAIGDRAGVPAQGGFGSPVVRVAAAGAGAGTASPATPPRAISAALQTSGDPAALPAGPAAGVPAPGTGGGAGATAGRGSGSPVAAPGAAPDIAPATAAATRAGAPLATSTDRPATSLLDRVVVGRSGPSTPAGDGSSAGAPAQAAPLLATPPLRSGGGLGVLSGGSGPSATPASGTGPTSGSQAPTTTDTSTATSAIGASPSFEASAAPPSNDGIVKGTVTKPITSTTAALTALGS